MLRVTHYMCYTVCRDEQGAVMYSAVLSQYNIMNHNERCEETRCYTIKLKTSLLTFADKILDFKNCLIEAIFVNHTILSKYYYY